MQRAPASIITLLALTFGTVPARAADAQDVTSRAALIQEAEKTKSESLRPAEPGKAEAYVARLSDAFLSGDMHWHAFWTNAYSGGGFTLGAGYLRHVSSYNLLDVRGSRDVVVLNAGQMPHQPRDRVGVRVEPYRQLLGRQAAHGFVDGGADPPEGVHEELAARHVLSPADAAGPTSQSGRRGTDG